MQFRVAVQSVEYLDDMPDMRYEYESTDVMDFSEYVQSALRKIKDALNFDDDYRDTHQVVLTVHIDGVLQATEYFRRSETENKTITTWRVIHNR